MTSDSPGSYARLGREFEHFADVIEAAGPVPAAAELARNWARTAELEQRLADLKQRVAKRK